MVHRNARHTILAHVSGLVLLQRLKFILAKTFPTYTFIWWSKLGATEVARELLSSTDRCPQSLKENALKGAEMNIKNHDQS